MLPSVVTLGLSALMPPASACFLASEGEPLQDKGATMTSPVPEASTSAPRDWPSSDAVEVSGGPAVGAEYSGGGLSTGKVKLRHDKRPRPLVLRRNAGDGPHIIF